VIADIVESARMSKEMLEFDRKINRELTPIDPLASGRREDGITSSKTRANAPERKRRPG
jgi:hypothetical protein